MTASDLTAQEVDALGLRPSLRVRVPEHVVYRAFPEQSVVLNLDRGDYHGLNRSGSMVFALLADGETLAAVAHALSKRYQLSPEPAQRTSPGYASRCSSEGSWSVPNPIDHNAAYGFRWAGLSSQALAVAGSDDWPIVSVQRTATSGSDSPEVEQVGEDTASIQTLAARLRLIV